MKTLIADVKAFHEACGVPIRETLSWPSIERIELRQDLVAEEVNVELFDAITARDMVKTADAIGDSIYVLVGMAVEFGIPLDRVWAAIQAANMAKRGPDGKVKYREDGKVLKPDGWRPPDIAGVLGLAA